MYFQTFGGSALLHLLAAHPRVVALFGIPATVTMLMAPQGPGRYAGTAGHLERLEAAIRPQAGLTEERQVFAERRAAQMLERHEGAEISAAVGEMLRRCGSGCTDISSNSIVSDPAMLRRVLYLYELDQLARVPKPMREVPFGHVAE